MVHRQKVWHLLPVHIAPGRRWVNNGLQPDPPQFLFLFIRALERKKMAMKIHCFDSFFSAMFIIFSIYNFTNVSS